MSKKGKFFRTEEYKEKQSRAHLKSGDRNSLYLKVKELAKEGLTTIKIAKRLNISYPSCRNFARHYNDKELLKDLDKNCFEAQSKVGKSHKGRKSYLKGKTYEEIFGSKEKAEQRSNKTSKWMKTEKNIRRFCRHPSKPQIELFNKITKKYFEEKVILEYWVKVSDSMTIWLDVAIPSLKIDYELDGEYWHKDKEKDMVRDKLLKVLGWKIIRILYKK